MDWDTARAVLISILADIAEVDEVFTYPPESGDDLAVGRVSVVLAPPGRSAVRGPGRLQVTVRQTLTVMSPIAGGVVAAMAAVDAAAHAIDTEMEQHVTLEGLVSATVPINWEPGGPLQYPPDTGSVFAAQTGTLEAMLITSPDRAA